MIITTFVICPESLHYFQDLAGKKERHIQLVGCLHRVCEVLDVEFYSESGPEISL
jgi:hypothetical protein